MAAEVDYGALDAEKGVYGIFDDFYVKINRSAGPIVFNLKYRVRLTVNGVQLAFRDIGTNVNNTSIINPVSFLRDSYFISENNMDLQFPSKLDKSYATVLIEIGEIFASVSGGSPTFQGYDTSDTFYFFNGYTTQTENTFLGYSNYRLPSLYDTSPLKLAAFNLNPKIIEGDHHYLTYFGIIPFDTDDFNADTVNVTFKDSSGSTISSTSATASLFAGVGLYYIDIGTTGTFTYPSNWQTAEFYITYEDASLNTLDSEVLTINKQEASPKNDRIRLRYWNQYGGLEYFNFDLKNYREVNIRRGKTVLSSNVDRTATTFSNIKNLSDPERYTYGDSKELMYTVNSNWLNAEEMESISQLLDSPKVVWQDINNNLIPVIIETNSMRIVDLRNELKQVEIKFKLSNKPKSIIR